MSDAPNPLFGDFQPTAIEPVKENPFTGETAKKPREKREKKYLTDVDSGAHKPKKVKAVKAPRKPRAPKAAPAIKPVEPPVSNLAVLFTAMKDLHTEDHALFEKLLAASPASRKRVFTAIAKIFP